MLTRNQQGNCAVYLYSWPLLDRRRSPPAPAARAGTDPDRYKWIALSNTTLAVLLATLDASITLIAMPSIFRGIHLDPLVPAHSFYLLWMILGYLVVTSVLIVSLGRLGDMFGRGADLQPRLRQLHGPALALPADDRLDDGRRAEATYLIVFRIAQGVGGACLLANAAAIITDAFPANQRGMALGINNIVGSAGCSSGLILGGLLAPGRLAAGLPDLGAGRPVRQPSGPTSSSRSAARRGGRRSTGWETSRSHWAWC